MKKIIMVLCTCLMVNLYLSAQETYQLDLTDEQYLQLEKHFKQKSKEKKWETDWAKYYRYAGKNDSLTVAPKVVFMGNSITDTWAKKRPDFFEKNNFAGRGISGQTSSHMLVRFQADVIALHPKAVVILAGTNDVAQNNGCITNEHILQNIQSMCELAKIHKIKPIVCSVLPAYQYPWHKSLQPAEDIKKLNILLKNYALANKITYVDYYSVFVDERGGMPAQYAHDGVHPTDEGYAVMEKIILKVL